MKTLEEKTINCIVKSLNGNEEFIACVVKFAGIANDKLREKPFCQLADCVNNIKNHLVMIIDELQQASECFKQSLKDCLPMHESNENCLNGIFDVFINNLRDSKSKVENMTASELVSSTHCIDNDECGSIEYLVERFNAELKDFNNAEFILEPPYYEDKDVIALVNEFQVESNGFQKELLVSIDNVLHSC